MEASSAREIDLALSAVALDGSARPYRRLLEEIRGARFVLIGEASHGTHEFHRERSLITQRLIVDGGFDAVAVEADWPGARRVHRYVQRRGTDRTPEDALGGFHRFPRWLWRNVDVRDFVRWLRRRAPQVAFYGLDLYDLHASIEIVLGYLEEIDPEAAERARARYASFEQFASDTSGYRHPAGLGLTPSCEHEVTAQLLEMHQEMRQLAACRSWADELADEELSFQVEQNARLVQSVEDYYRALLKQPAMGWNLRARHMADTLAAIVQHLDRRLGRPCKVVVWGHNVHLGDARATELGADGELSVGQIVRERYGPDAFLVGLTTYEGVVTAALDWGDKPLRVALRPAIQGSHELMLHAFMEEMGFRGAVFLPGETRRLPHALRRERLERAVGVVDRAESHTRWFRARLGDQFDAVIHIDRTSEAEPLDPPGDEKIQGELPETYPFGV